MQLAESSSRVLSAPQILGESFYRHLFKQVPEVEPFFEGIDMRRQSMLVTMALTVIQQHYDQRYPVTQSFLQYLGSGHAARGIPFDLYPKWRDAMLGTLAGSHGTDWNEELSGQWRNDRPSDQRNAERLRPHPHDLASIGALLAVRGSLP